MSVKGKNQFIKAPVSILPTVPLSAKAKKAKLEKVQDLHVPLLELIYKADADRSKRPTVGNSLDAFEIFLVQWDWNKIELVKQLKILLLTNANKVLGISEVATGCMDKALFDPKFIFSAALLSGAGKIILGNNNTSGNVKPSREDFNATRSLALSGRLMGIEVVDHLIFSKDAWFSFADNGLMQTDFLGKSRPL
ncbi:JAB domain-containing protein [Paraflavitalea sp. CAU 1676]|uniref:JAB domain-containing protein n=1 Tax=Paraflavitalea sp. CAU 1676 TaxID=3032598 RepID=UPI0023DA14CB|nr:JAB domain-containing protein [Paraflavitalea sp. CAU 1676]MDF2191387.1 JAB domain-containing protein [Paraflavitalea sp. CAU 1676]